MFWSETLLGALPCATLLGGSGGGSVRIESDPAGQGFETSPTVIVVVAPQEVAEVRRTPARLPDPDSIELGSRRVDLDRCTVTGPDGQTTLTARELELLRLLADRRGSVVERDELVREMWGAEADSSGSALDVTVYRLRRKIEDDPSDPVWLRSVRGVGLVLERDGDVSAPPAHHLPVVDARPA